MTAQHDRLPWPTPNVPCSDCIKDQSRWIARSADGSATLYCEHHLVYARVNYFGGNPPPALPIWSCHSPVLPTFVEVLLSNRPSLLRRWRERQDTGRSP